MHDGYNGSSKMEAKLPADGLLDENWAKDFAKAWHVNWCNVDVDAVVSHFTDDAEMRSPLALKMTGSPIIKGSDRIREYWRQAYGHVKSADLKLLSWSWDVSLRRLTIWWQLNDARASEFMDFDASGRVIRSEAFYGK